MRFFDALLDYLFRLPRERPGCGCALLAFVFIWFAAMFLFGVGILVVVLGDA